MNPPSLLFALASFGVGVFAAVSSKSMVGAVPSAGPATRPTNHATKGPLAKLADAPAGAPGSENATGESDARLLLQCRDLCNTNPEAAFRAGIARWGFDVESLTAAADALVKADPAAAQRLLAECPDLRSKCILKGALLVDEVLQNPQDKLPWAEKNLQGQVKTRVLNAGMAVLASLDPDAALNLLAEWPPSQGRQNRMGQALAGKMKQDPAAALHWIDENVPLGKRALARSMACDAYAASDPGGGISAVSTLPVEFRQQLGNTIAAKAVQDPTKSLPQVLEIIGSMPAEIQSHMIRVAATNLVLENQAERSQAGFLAALSKPEQRASAITHFAALQLSYYYGDSSLEQNLEWIFQLKTQEDKQSAARVVPYLDSLTETQRDEILHRLK